MDDQPFIQVDPQIMLGKPCIAGTRITVEAILEDLSAGQPEEEILASYPRLTPESLDAAQTYAKRP
ncbi:DUF433 domain-containing protein [Brevifollis gellanilyticus]|uniref:Antitoxin n=1 Tax=Brevifollis gellanilyticus TaxID=748831 RepID=A0A512MAR3_9BACT|nr:DUF433 domain-containing protein [Brevifollis gellanilyticus]GEP43431.1 hypothetical protein BGE01nite_27220 [Brevifollis gellanilyticus]